MRYSYFLKTGAIITLASAIAFLNFEVIAAIHMVTW